MLWFLRQFRGTSDQERHATTGLTGEEDGVCESMEWEAQSKDRVVTDLFYGHERVCVSVPQSHDPNVDRRRHRHSKADLLSSLLS